MTVQSASGETPLHNAAANGKVDVVNIWIRERAEPEAKDSS